jgi:hypothetical protein
MSGTLSDKGKEAAAIKAEKRAAALRENLKRRKAATDQNKGQNDAKSQTAE